MADLKTPLYQCHVDLGAKMVAFAGWQMPLMYKSIIEEHLQTRNACSVFDVSHMGRIELSGAEAAKLLDGLSTRRIADMPVNTTRYALMCNGSGGVLDDVMISRLGDERFLIVCNAANREKIIKHIQAHLGGQVQLHDRTFETIMLAIQGPTTPSMVNFLPEAIKRLEHRRLYNGHLFGVSFIVFRGGYTGEDGFEVILPINLAAMVWQHMISSNPSGIVAKPAGLGARDTLRLEAGLPLYGHELTEQIDPISARLDYAVDLDHQFLGCDAVATIRKTGPQQLRVGLKLDSPRTARQGCPVLHRDQPVGQVTSGCISPTLRVSIAMAYVDSDVARVGQALDVRIREQVVPARVVDLPFYRRKH